MNAQVVATVTGIAAQLGGASYLVYQSYHTSKRLAKYKSPVTYDTFSSAIDDLAHEVHGQFALQLRGFIAVVLGSLLQLYGALPVI